MNRIEAFLKTRYGRASLLLSAVFVLVLPMIVPGFYMHTITISLIFGALAVSLGFLISYTGLVDFGHPAYFGIAAYAVTIIASRADVPIVVSIPVTLAFVSMIALLVAQLSIRTTGVYFAIIQLAFLFVVQRTLSAWTPVTGGHFGYFDIQSVAPFGFNMQIASNFYYVGLAVLVGTYVSLRYLLRTPFGDTLVAVRDNELRAIYLGYNTNFYKRLAFTLSAFIAAVTGIMYTYYNGFLSPQIVSFGFAGELFLMVLIGGLNSLIGPIIGTFALESLRIAFNQLFGVFFFFMGIALVLIVIYLPEGVIPYILQWINDRFD